MLLLLIVVKSE